MTARRLPNVLILFSDQHNASVLGCENHPDVRTPHLDRLAAEGVRFSRAYCQDAVCTPSRCSLFSGLYPRTLGVMGNCDRSPVMSEVVSLPSAFQAAGYRTAAFGKRHLYEGCDEGWDIKASHLVKESPADNYVGWVRAEGHGAAFDRDWAAEFGCGAEGTPEHEVEMPHALLSARASLLPPDCTMEAWTKRRTIDFLREQAGAERPFFCFASFYRPHQPYTPLPEYFERFDRSHWGRGRLAGDGLALPPTLRQPIAELPPLFQEQSRGGNRIWRFDLAREDEQLYREGMAAYYALVEEIDDHVGEILGVIDEIAPDTVVIYTSDHGDFAGAHGMLEKCAAGHNVYEDTLRVPLIFRAPGRIAEGRVCDSLAELLDVYPTLLDVCGVPRPALQHPLAGRSLAGVLRGDAETGRVFSLSENNSQAAVITDRFKLGTWQKPELPGYPDFSSFGDLLFDRINDPGEMRNLAGDPAYGEVEAVLRGHLADWRGQYAGPA